MLLSCPKAHHSWNDTAWMSKRAATAWHKAPMSAYRSYAPGSWRRKGEQGEQYLDYQDLIEQLIPMWKGKVLPIELMPISEFPSMVRGISACGSLCSDPQIWRCQWVKSLCGCLPSGGLVSSSVGVGAFS